MRAVIAHARGEETARAIPPQRSSHVGAPQAALADWLTSVAHDCGFDRQPLQIRRCRKVFRPGDQDRALYLVRRGLVATVVSGRGSRKCITRLAGPGDVFGELSLASQCAAEEAAVVMRDATLIRIPVAAVHARMTDAGPGSMLLVHFARLLGDAQHKLAMLLKCNAEQRLAVTLIGLAALGDRVDGVRHGTPPLTQQELAEVIGTTRTRVCTFLCRFRERGLITVGAGDSYLVDAAALRAHLQASFAPRGSARRIPMGPLHAAAG